MASKNKREPENAVLTILSTQTADGETDRSELNSTALYRIKDGNPEISYTELDEQGEEAGKTVITILGENLVTIRKTGFTEALMVLERGKTHPVKYDTVLGSMEMLLCALDVESAFGSKGGRLRLKYLIDIGESYSAMNTIELRVSLR